MCRAFGARFVDVDFSPALRPGLFTGGPYGPHFPSVTICPRGPHSPSVIIGPRGPHFPSVTICPRGPHSPSVIIGPRGPHFPSVTICPRGPHFPSVTICPRGPRSLSIAVCPQGFISLAAFLGDVAPLQGWIGCHCHPLNFNRSYKEERREAPAMHSHARKRVVR